TPGGPASKAGLKVGDVITKIDGKAIENSDELIVAIRSKNIGDRVKIEYQRNNVTRETTVTLAGSGK
ncbi:MAG: PDZ domain-containing protein, partial [Actinobacteria bacterium]|nr:PDZ domain-containing protein [Actinomycetota bacterium]